MGKENFERSWHQAFDGAQMEPSERLWVGIEAVIANDDASRYRKGLVYYKWMVAAGILLIASLLGYLGYQQGIPAESTTSDGSNSQTPLIVIDSIQTTYDLEDVDSRDEKNNVNESDVTESPQAIALPQSNQATPQAIDPTPEQLNSHQLTDNQRSTLLDQPSDNQTAASASLPVALIGLEAKGAAIDSSLAVISAPDNIYGVVLHPENKQALRDQTLWAGLNMTPGYFNPNYQLQGVTQALQSPSLDQSSGVPMEEHRTGLSMSFGMDVGMKLSKRWQVSGGLHYLNNNVQSTTNTILDQRTPVFSSVAESLDFSNSRGGDITFTETELDNTFQFISVPVQAGFIVVDKKLQLLINAGIASDIFLKNRVTTTDNSLDPVTIRPGSDAPFRSIYFNGLLGAQASYEFLPRYMITVEPRYKLAISDFARPEANYTSLPSSFGLGVGVKYVFK